MEHNRDISFTKSDFWRAFAAGAIIALFAVPVLENIKIFEIAREYDPTVLRVALIAWFMILPLASALGLFVFYRMALIWRPVAFEVGKYGLVGWLNTFLQIGVFNGLIWITAITQGLAVDLFAVISFVAAATNGFFWNKFWTFNAYGTNRGKSEYIKYFSVVGITSLLNTTFLHLMVNVVGAPQGFDPKIWANVVLATLIPISFIGNFLGSKFFAFKKLP
ncbi:MAG: GtrA family protein [Candidatus Niyogibacteria bacterium]|nr:GtrA family protein [Candidatus Niyogibacteria bacterium]